LINLFKVSLIFAVHLFQSVENLNRYEHLLFAFLFLPTAARTSAFAIDVKCYRRFGHHERRRDLVCAPSPYSNNTKREEGQTNNKK